MKKYRAHIKHIPKIKWFMCLLFLQMNRLVVYADTKKGTAGSITDSKASIGLENLLGDIGILLLKFTLPVAGACAGYFFLRLNTADATDQKQWKSRIWLTVFCTIGSFCAGGVLTAISGYFK